MLFLWQRGATLFSKIVKSNYGVTPEKPSKQDLFLQKAGTVSIISMVPNTCIVTISTMMMMM